MTTDGLVGKQLPTAPDYHTIAAVAGALIVVVLGLLVGKLQKEKKQA